MISQVPDEMRKSVGDFFTSRLLVWSEQDARAVMGDPFAHRYAYDQVQNVTGDFYSFHDPTMNLDCIDLGFESKTNRLTDVYLYPKAAITWEDCKKAWGDDVTVTTNPDGSRFTVLYNNRRLNVLLDRNDRVISLGLY